MMMIQVVITVIESRELTHPLAGRACTGAVAGSPTVAGAGTAAGFTVCFGLASVNKCYGTIGKEIRFNCLSRNVIRVIS